MMMMTTTVIMLIMISTMMIMVNTMISKKSFNDREKSSPFECGFDPKSSPRLPFSLQFFLIAMIFLVFDVELTLLFPLITTMKISNIMNYYMLYLLFSLILLIGIYHEWNQGALNWVY